MIGMEELPEGARGVLGWWRTARGEEALPHADAIDPVPLWTWLGDLNVIEGAEGDRRLIITLVGTRILEHMGKRCQGEQVADCVRGDPRRSPVLGLMEAALAQSKPAFARLPGRSILGMPDWADVLALPFRSDTPTGRLLVWLAPAASPEPLRSEDEERTLWARLVRLGRGPETPIYMIDD